MSLSWTKVRSKFKVPLRVVGWCLWRSLQRRTQKCQRLKLQRDAARQDIARQDAEIAQQQKQLGKLQDRLRTLEVENRRLIAAPCRLPDDPPLESYKYGLRMICLGVRASQLPPPGEALKHEDVRVLMVQPGTRWKREDMAAVYDQLAERCGPPRAVLCDGAVELREGVESLKKRRCDTIVMQDFKHKAATFLKSHLEHDSRFAEFNAAMGKARSAIQQTEMSHLTPPSQKPKARFMNLGSTLECPMVPGVEGGTARSAVAWQERSPESEDGGMVCCSCADSRPIASSKIA